MIAASSSARRLRAILGIPLALLFAAVQGTNALDRIQHAIVGMPHEHGLLGTVTMEMTLFESRVLRLASAGGRNRQPHKAFIDIVLQAAGQQEQGTRNSERLAEFDTWVPSFPQQDDADAEGLPFELWLEKTVPPLIRAMSDDELIERLTELGTFRPDD